MGFLTTTIDSNVSDNMMEDITRPAIVKFPAVVAEALGRLGHLFPNDPERRHLAEHLTGLMIAHKKNVSAINREFAITTDQSCLNRWINGGNWDEETLNQDRLTTLGQVCMTVLRHTLSDTIAWVIDRIEGDNWNFNRIKF
jgi:hypothetical protein